MQRDIEKSLVGVERWIEKGEKFLEKENYKKSLENYEKAIKKDENNSKALFGKGLALYKLMEYKRAMKTLEKASKMDSENAKIWYYLGNTYRYSNEDEKAIKAYKKAKKIFKKTFNMDPGNEKTWYYLGNTYYRLRQHKKAIKAYEKAIEINPNYKKALYSKGRALYDLEKYKDTLECFNKAIDIDKDYIYAYNAKGCSLYNLGRYKDAAEAFEKSIEIIENNGIEKKDISHVLPYTNLGELYLIQGDLDNASEKIDEALYRDRNNSTALVLKGLLKIEEKDYYWAIEYFRESIHSDMDDPVPLLWSAYAKYLKAECSLGIEDKEYEEKMFTVIKEIKYKEEIFIVIRELEKANELCKRDPQKKLKACILYFLGYFYYQHKDIIAAKEKLEECVKLESKSPAGRRASELLNYIWDYEIRPPWWRWWLYSPLNCRRKRAAFFILLTPLFLLLFHSTIYELLPFIKVDRTISFIVLVISIFTLLSPSIQSIKTNEFDITLQSPPSLEFYLTPSMMRKGIKKHGESEEYVKSLTLLQKILSPLRFLFRSD